MSSLSNPSQQALLKSRSQETSGLRKPFKVFQQQVREFTSLPHPLRTHTYRIELHWKNFIQAIFDSIDAKRRHIVVAGDGRYFSHEAVPHHLAYRSAKRLGKFIIGSDGILSTPAASNVIPKVRRTAVSSSPPATIPVVQDTILASRYTVSNGGPAPENSPTRSLKKTKTIRDVQGSFDEPAVMLISISIPYIMCLAISTWIQLDLSKTGELVVVLPKCPSFDSVEDLRHPAQRHL
ncbi:hypothetical protein APHAL10511_000767 [Amanita phalloides]|nr:hypothetical protein APHAL10511_000767 [Amanita phalloides]